MRVYRGCFGGGADASEGLSNRDLVRIFDKASYWLLSGRVYPLRGPTVVNQTLAQALSSRPCGSPSSRLRDPVASSAGVFDLRTLQNIRLKSACDCHHS